MWVKSVLTCWILFFLSVFSLVGSCSYLSILLFRMSVHGSVVDDFCSFSLSVHQSWLIMLVLSERECSPVSEASDPVCVWRHCTSHWPKLQAVPGGCADHSPAGLPGPGGQGRPSTCCRGTYSMARLAAVLDKLDWTVLGLKYMSYKSTLLHVCKSFGCFLSSLLKNSVVLLT